MKDYATMSDEKWAKEFDLDTEFTTLDALVAMKRSLGIDYKEHGHMCKGRNGEHLLYIGLPYTDRRHYHYSLMWDLDGRKVRVKKDKRYYPNGVEHYEDYRTSYFSVTFPETHWLVQRVLKALNVRGSNKSYNRLWGAFTCYCMNYRKELL